MLYSFGIRGENFITNNNWWYKFVFETVKIYSISNYNTRNGMVTNKLYSENDLNENMVLKILIFSVKSIYDYKW